MCDHSGTSHPLAPRRAKKLRVERALCLQDSRGAPAPNQHPVLRERAHELRRELRLPSTSLLAVSERPDRVRANSHTHVAFHTSGPESVSKFRVLCVHELLSKMGKLEKNGPYLLPSPHGNSPVGPCICPPPLLGLSPLSPHFSHRALHCRRPGVKSFLDSSVITSEDLCRGAASG